jgi:hypothetical protein
MMNSNHFGMTIQYTSSPPTCISFNKRNNLILEEIKASTEKLKRKNKKSMVSFIFFAVKLPSLGTVSLSNSSTEGDGLSLEETNCYEGTIKRGFES